MGGCVWGEDVETFSKVALEKQVRCSQNASLGTCPLTWLWTLTYRYPPTPKPISSLFRDSGLPVPFTIYFLMPPWPCPPPIQNSILICTSIPKASWSQYLVTSLGLLHPSLIFFLLAAPPNIMASLFPQLRQPQCWLRAWLVFVFTLIIWHCTHIYRHESDRWCDILPFVTYFYHSTFPGFPFILILK